MNYLTPEEITLITSALRASADEQVATIANDMTRLAQIIEQYTEAR